MEKCNFCINPHLMEVHREEARLFKEGLGPVEIGARLNVPPGEVRRHIREAGYLPSRQEIREWVKKGWIEKEEILG